MKIKFWGVRGSIPSPVKGHLVRNKVKKILSYASAADITDPDAIDRFIETLPFSLVSTYGGNTTCLEIRNDENDLVIVDSGTGIRELGMKLMHEGFAKGKGECHMLFTHTHWDHIQGLPFFVPFYIEGNIFHIHAVSDEIESRLRYQHSQRHFPVQFDFMEATKKFYQHKEGEEFQIGDMKITSRGMKHPGGSYSYRFEQNGKTMIFGSDAEFQSEDMHDIDPYIEYFKNADVLVFDTQYTFEEQLQKIDWGHSSSSIATDIALRAGVKKLVLFHHDPSYDDEKLDEVYNRALRYREMMDPDHKSGLEIKIAYEGLEVVV